ncbi:MAG: Ig-like domain-containing protein [Gemmatimonadaceae bacterium]
MQKFTRSLFALGALAGLAACGDDVSIVEPPKPTPRVESISVTPASLALRVGQTATLSATVTANDASVVRTVTWTSSAPNIASVSTAGVVTALAAGQTTVTAAATADPTFRAAVQVTVGGLGVTSISVAPPSATLAPGDQLQVVANVTADAGVARTVTWSSSSPATATVTSAGVVTAVANGTASIVARSTVDTAIFGAMALTVASVPATVSIKSITRNTGSLITPVDIDNTFGQVDVTLNVDPGSRQLCKVAVLIDGTEVASQTFGSSNIQISDSALMALVPTDVVLSVNTRRYNATTGVPSFFNGPHTLSAQLTTRQGTTCASAPSASVSQTLTFRNVSGFIGTVSTSGSASAQDVAGFVWRTGALTITALPVIFGDVNAPFTRPTIASALISHGTLFCVAGGVRTLAATASGATWNVTFNNTDAAAAVTNVVGYELNALGCPGPLQIGEVPRITAVGTDGNAIPLIAAGTEIGFLNSPNLVGNQFAEPNASFAVRLDNLAPARPAVTPPSPPNIGGFLSILTTDTLRTNRWLNAVLLLDDACTIGVATGNIDGDTTVVPYPGTLVRNCVLSRALDLGVGRLGPSGQDPLDYQIRVGDAALGSSGVDATSPVQTATGLAESSSNNTYLLRARVADQLGNRSGASSVNFGVDNTPPRLGVDTATTTGPVLLQTGTAPQARTINAAHGIALNTVLIAFVATDTASGGAVPSGFFNLAGNPLVTSVRRTRWTGTSVSTNWYCPATGFQPSLAGGGVCAQWFSGVNQNFRGPLTQTFTNAGTSEGYFLATSLVADQGGNFSGTQTVEFLFDVTAPAVGGISSPAFLTGGQSATFSTSAQDNQDLGSGVFTLLYNGTAEPFRYPSIAMGTFGSDVFTTSANLALQYAFIRNLQLAPGGVPNGAVGNIPTTVTATALDVAGNPSAVSSLTIPAGSIQGPPVAFPAPATAAFTWNITAPAAAVTVSRDDQAVGAAVNQVMITAQAVGAGSQAAPPALANPFTSRVEFWARPAGAGQQWRQIGTSTSPSVSENGPGTLRTWSFSITWNPTANNAPNGTAGAYRIMAIGVSAAGDALGTDQTSANANFITITIP